MSDVKRYVVGGVLPFGPHKDERLMIERARGQWIKASDYDALAAQLATANERLREAERAIPRLLAWLDMYIAGTTCHTKATAMRDFWKAWLAGSAGGSDND